MLGRGQEGIWRRALIAFAVWLAAAPYAEAIYRGRDVPARGFPFVVSLYIESVGAYALCGGTLIADQWALTAAHCLVDENVQRVFVYAGSDHQWQGDKVEVDRWVVNPGYDAAFHSNDIALLHLTRAPRPGPVPTVRWSTNANRFPDMTTHFSGDPDQFEIWKQQLAAAMRRDVTVVGWGLTAPTRPEAGGAEGSRIIPGTAEILQMLDFRVASSAYCNARWELSLMANLSVDFASLGLEDDAVRAILDKVRAAGPKAFPAGAFCGSASVDTLGEPVGGGPNVSLLPASEGGGLCLGLGCRGPDFCVDPGCDYAIPIEREASDCQGDSGGPILVKEADGSWTQVGLVSYGVAEPDEGIMCGLTLAPSVFTNVAVYDAWIRSVIGKQ